MPGAIVGDIVGSVYEFAAKYREYGQKYASSHGSIKITEFLREWQDEIQLGGTSEEGFQEFMRAHKAARKTWDENKAPEPEAALRIGDSLIGASEDELSSISRFIVHTCRPTAQSADVGISLDALEDCLHDTEGIATTYFDLELDDLENSEDEDLGGIAAIRKIPSQITRLYSASDWNSVNN